MEVQTLYVFPGGKENFIKIFKGYAKKIVLFEPPLIQVIDLEEDNATV